MKLRKRNTLIHGVGINDAPYPVTKSVVINGKPKNVWVCPYYQKWVSILARCYSKSRKNKYRTYEGCTIDESWVRLSNFIKWVDSQPNRNWQNCEPDKDLLVEGNKVYGPETVAFLSDELNAFITDGGHSKHHLLMGVSWRNDTGKFRARCSNPFSDSEEGRSLGQFDNELEAHLAWKAKKHEYACMFADLQTDERVATALRERYK